MGISPVAEATVTEAYDPVNDVVFFDAGNVYSKYFGKVSFFRRRDRRE